LAVLNPLHLRTLIEVIHGGSFAAAARKLGYTASAVSQQMALLERAVDVPLFERNPQSAQPTAAAEMLSALASDVVAQLRALDYEISGLSSGRLGRLRIGTFPSASRRVIPPALASFVAQRPAVEILLDEAEPDELIRALQAGDLDLVLVYRYSLTPRRLPARLRQSFLLSEELLLLIPEGHALLDLENVALPDAANETWVSSREGTAGEACLRLACASAGFSPRIALRSNNYQAIQALVASGMGVALVPALGYEASLGGVVAQRPADLYAHREVIVLTRVGDTNPVLPLALTSFRNAALGLEEGRGLSTSRAP
jgi:DNA-binding transcriptional LysR family regulator